MAKIIVDNSEITILEINNKDYISLTDMVRNIENGSALIEKWLADGTIDSMREANGLLPSFEA